jgi:hypothetical protein
VKFHQLRPGARFRYRELVLRKVSPLKAASEHDDTQRLIPRSAEVTLLDDRGDAVAETIPATLAGSVLKNELSRLIASFEETLARTEPPLTDVQMAQVLQALHREVRDLKGRLANGT